MQGSKDMVNEEATFDQAASFIKDGKDDEAMSILQNTNLHLKAKSPENVTLLHIAVEAGNGEMTGRLVELGSDVEAKTTSGFTPLMMAIEKKHSSIVSFLIWSRECDTSYIDAISKLVNISDFRSDEYAIYHMILMKQMNDYLDSDEWQRSLSILKQLLS